MAHACGERVIVIGPSCSGKSTLGDQLQVLTGAPHTELDKLHWEPGWTPAAPEVFRERVRAVTAGERWILSGSYIAQQADISWARADMVVWMDMPFPVVLARLITRSWRRARSKELLWGTNYERFWGQLKFWDTNQSLVAFTVKTFWSRRKRDYALTQDPRWAHITFVRLRSSRDAATWLRSVERSVQPAGAIVPVDPL